MSQSRGIKVLIAMDGSDHALEAVRYVAGVLPPAQTQVVLYHIMKASPWRTWGLKKDPTYRDQVLAAMEATEQQELRKGEALLETGAQVFFNAGYPADSVEMRLEEKDQGVARDIITEAQGGYQAVVVGRRGLSPLKDMVLGTTANKLVSRLHKVPVWVVDGNLPGGDVLLALDESKGAMRAVDYVGALLGESDLGVTLLHVITNTETFRAVVKNYLPDGFEAKWVEEAKKAMSQVFEQAKECLVRSGLAGDRIKTKFIQDVTSRAGAVVEEAQRGGYGTIVLGRQGLNQMEEVFIGGVARKVVHLSSRQAVWVVN